MCTWTDVIILYISASLLLVGMGLNNELLMTIAIVAMVVWVILWV